jgi:hypothetical protein
MNKFTKASEIERQKMEYLFKKYNVSDYEFTPTESFESFDGVFTNSKKEKIVFEVKVRNVPSTQYKTTIIEEFKLDELLKKKEPSYVFVFFTDNKFMCHKIEAKENYKITKQLAPKTTCGNDAKIMKNFINIQIQNVKNYA